MPHLPYHEAWCKGQDAAMNKPAEKVPHNTPLGVYESLQPIAGGKGGSDPAKTKPVIIKKYANRRLYNT
jgi:hypothetical protein